MLKYSAILEANNSQERNMGGIEFNFVADYGGENPPPPSMLFIIVLGKMNVVGSHDELRDILQKLEEYGKLDCVVNVVNQNTIRALDNLHHGDDLYENRANPNLPPELIANMSVTLNCIVNDAVRAVRLGKEVVRAYLERPTGTTLQ